MLSSKNPFNFRTYKNKLRHLAAGKTPNLLLHETTFHFAKHKIKLFTGGAMNLIPRQGVRGYPSLGNFHNLKV